MNNAERITALEGLLARIQQNAALPRPPREHAAAQAAPAPIKASPVAPATAVVSKPYVPLEAREVAPVAAVAAPPVAAFIAPAAVVAQVPAVAPLPAVQASVFAREAVRPPATAGVLPPGAGRYGGEAPIRTEPTLPAEGGHRLGIKTQPGTGAVPNLTLEMDDPLGGDFDDEVTIMGPAPKAAVMLKAPTITPPAKAPVVTEVVARKVPEAAGSEPTFLILDDDIDVSFEDEATHESPAVAAAKAEAERLVAERAEADRRAEEWRLLEEEALHLEAEALALAKAAALAKEAADLEEAARVAAKAAEKAEAERLAQEAAEVTRRAEAAAAQAEIERAQAERVAAESAAKVEAERLAKEAADKAEAERVAVQIAAKAEADRLAKEAADKAEAERLAAEIAAKAEADRLAKEAADKAEAERLAAEIAAKAEADRLAQEAAARAEEERLAAEEQRLAKQAADEREREAAEQAAAEREASERAAEEQQARDEAQRLADELAAAAKVAVVADPAPPASARQPRDESRPVDEALVLDDEDDGPPASGQVQSQRKPTIHDELTHPAVAALSGWEDEETTDAPSSLVAAQTEEELRIAGKLPLAPLEEPTARVSSIRSVPPPPARPIELRLAVEPSPSPRVAPAIDDSPVVVAVTAQITTRPASAADAASFLGSVHAAAPDSFGDLFDDSLALGA